MASSSAKTKLVKRLFLDVDNSPVAFTSTTKVYKYVKDVLKRKDVTLAALKRFERTHVRPNQILRGFRGQKKKTLPYRSEGLDAVWQIDLADLHKSKGQRGAYAFALTAVDVFSRRGDAEPVFDKSSNNVTKAFKTICERRGVYPVRVQSDQGKEFMNSTFSDFCKSRRINHYYVNSLFKAAVVERFNRQIQNMLWKYKRAYPRRTVRTLLAAAVSNYNNTPHRLHGMNPGDVRGESAVRLMYANLAAEDRQLAEARAKPFAFKVGDKVRTTKERKIFIKGYRGFYTEEVFVVRNRFRRKPHVDVNLYELKDLIGRPIENSVYYEFELQKVQLPAQRTIKTILCRDRRRETLVTLADYPNDYVEWLRG